MMDDPPERHPTYYEMVPVCRCSRCGEDHTDFPGSYVEGPHYPSQAVWSYLVEHLKPLPDLSDRS